MSISTIVEIIEAYQPSQLLECLVSDLQQQKLQKLTSLSCISGPCNVIYNSRNYRSLLAQPGEWARISKSTIVEIIEAYQPESAISWTFRNLQQQKLQKLTSHMTLTGDEYESTIVEIIEAYQPQTVKTSPLSYLQQQKLQKLTSLAAFAVP